MANGVYNRGLYQIAAALTDLDAADLRILLLNDVALAFDRTHNFVADVIASGGEVSVSGYARQTLASAALTEDDTNHRATLDVADVTFTALAAGQAVAAAVVFRHTGSDATAPVLFYLDLRVEQDSVLVPTATDGTDFVIEITTAAQGGLVYLAAA